MEKVSKFKRGIVSEIKQEQSVAKQQEGLRRKYNLDTPENVVIVEKTNAYKFTLKAIQGIIKTAATVCLLLLATIGLMVLIYPSTREAFWNVIREVLQELSIYVPFLKLN